MTPATIYEKYSKAVVLIEVYNYRDELFSAGTGFNIDESGTIVTNYHVIEDAFRVTVNFGDGMITKFKGIEIIIRMRI